MLQYLILFVLVSLISAYDVCIVGGASGLGKELIYQSIIDKGLSVLALTSSPSEITTPCRVNSFTEIRNQPEFQHPDLKIDNYWKDLDNYNYKHIIFTTSAKPFENDYSDKLMKKILNKLPTTCKSISLVSANDVGNKLKNSWYLKDVYRAKNEQEKILKDYNSNLKKIFYRPKALSYGETVSGSTMRKDLAKEILKKID